MTELYMGRYEVTRSKGRNTMTPDARSPCATHHNGETLSMRVGIRVNNYNIPKDNRKVAEQEPLVSVVVPSFNHSSYILQCLNSIEALTHKRLELIVSDDCSSDDTFILAEDWVRGHASRFERSAVVRQVKNLGIVKNIQHLFDASHGEYIALIASDDLFEQSAVSVRLRVLQEDENLDAVFGNAQSISALGDVLQERRIPLYVAKKLASPKLLTPTLLKYWHLGLAGPGLMLRKRTVFNDGCLGILPHDLPFEDRYIYIRLAAQGKLKYIDVILAKYRMIGNSASRSPEFSLIAGKGVAASDSHNSHLLHGLEKLYIKGCIARSNLKIGPGSRLNFQLRLQFLKFTNLLLWELLKLWSTVGFDRRCANASVD